MLAIVSCQVQTYAFQAIGQTSHADTTMPKKDKKFVFLNYADSSIQFDSVAFCDCKSKPAGDRTSFLKSLQNASSSDDQFLAVQGAVVNYQYLYQSALDTPFAEKNISQHNAMLQLNLQLAKIFPIQARVWTRQSNSAFYRDITDFQLVYDQAGFSRQLYSGYRDYVLSGPEKIAVQAAEDCLDKQSENLKKYKSRFGVLGMKQKMIEAYEVLTVPQITYDLKLPDSINIQREIDYRAKANAFLESYGKYQKNLAWMQHRFDSLSLIKDKLLRRIEFVKNLLNRPDWQDIALGSIKTDSLDNFGEGLKMPAYMRWLAGLRKFSIGRTSLNSSDLTAKNTSINGFSFEYNSWYYLSAAIGKLDYRYRDFVLNGRKTPAHPFYLLRLGLGKVQADHIIISGFSGTKPFPGYGSPDRSMRVSGMTLEGRKMISRNIWVSGEVGQSISPDYSRNPAADQTKIGFHQQGNTAFAIKAGGYFPKLQARAEGSYKKAGINYQSFSTWQVNTATQSWQLKWDQSFFKRTIRLSAYIKSNEWENPYLTQAYSTNTLLKSATITFQRRRWPTISAGYIPIAQLAKIGEQIVETRYQMLSTNIWHGYRYRQVSFASNLSYLRSFDGYDSSLYYQNNSNLLLSQTIFFKLFTSTLGASWINNLQFKMSVWDHKLQVPLRQAKTNMGMGVKVYHYNQTNSKVGCSVNAAFSVFGTGQLGFFFEKGFLPQIGKGLIPADMGSIQFIKSFQFKRSS